MPSSRDAVLVTRYLEPFISKCLNAVKVILTQYHESAMILWNCWIVVRLFLIPIIGGISYKRRQWLIWGYGDTRLPSLRTRGPKCHTSKMSHSHVIIDSIHIGRQIFSLNHSGARCLQPRVHLDPHACATRYLMWWHRISKYQNTGEFRRNCWAEYGVVTWRTICSNAK